MEAVTDLIFSGSKLTADSDCSYEIQRPLLLGRKAMTNLDSVLKAEINIRKSTTREMLGWTKHKLESRLLGEISITSDMQVTPLLWQKVKRN